jgi:type IV secretory pathway TrbD component
MKGLVALLLLLAAAKIGMHEYMVRSATNEVIILAYRDRAIAACQGDSAGAEIVPVTAWANPRISLSIGKSNLGVYIWQVDHALWNARYKNPYLYLQVTAAGAGTGAGEAAPPGKTICEFDIVQDHATVYRAS